MPIEYSLAERGNPGDSKAPKKFYAVARSTGETTVRGLAKRISDISTVSTVDVMAVLEAFFQTVPEELAAGHIVRFGDFGSFAVSLQGEGAASEGEFVVGLINNVKVVFRPGKLFAQAMQNAELKRVNTVLPATQARSTRKRTS
jgi:predicted histone-like DNA-binding protein